MNLIIRSPSAPAVMAALLDLGNFYPLQMADIGIGREVKLEINNAGLAAQWAKVLNHAARFANGTDAYLCEVTARALSLCVFGRARQYPCHECGCGDRDCINGRERNGSACCGACQNSGGAAGGNHDFTDGAE